MSHSVNISRIKEVKRALEPLKDNIVFVGGATVSLYAERMAGEVRPTNDVDLLVEIWSRWDFAEFEAKVRQLGFVNDMKAKFLGRYILGDIIVDLMPTSPEILGFTNKWYKEGFKASVDFEIDETTTIKILPAEYFIATKIEAFKNRGHGDGRFSNDFEDLIFVLDNRDSIWNEIEAANPALRSYLAEEFETFLGNFDLGEWIYAHTATSSPPPVEYIVNNMKKIASSVHR
ncbi:MAG: hypothetical protein KGM16_00765 [Bacteroidota bacterium]|nr:hypothetical protein [Bacteroidota bacterium]